MSVLVSTAYMEEAERFEHLIAMNAGRVLAEAAPADLRARTGTDSVGAAYVALGLMMRLLRSISFTPYVIYRVVLGIVLLAIAYS